MNQRTLTNLCVAIWLSFLVIGLWPFNFLPRNNVSWLAGGHGVRFGWYGIAYSSKPDLLHPPGTVFPRDSVTVELWIKTVPEMLDRYAYILSLYQPGCDHCFAIMQSGDTLRMNGRYRNSQGSAQETSLPLHDYFTSGPFSSGAIQLLTVTAGPKGLAAYLGDRLFGSYPDFSPLPESLGGQLVLGHSADGQLQWSGQIFGLALYDRALDGEEVRRDYRLWADNTPSRLAAQPGIAALFIFDEGQGPTVHNRLATGADVVIPKIYRPLQRTFLELPTPRDYSYKVDVILNVFGFVPFGYLFAGYFLRVRRQNSRRSVILAIAVGLITSLLIELLQAYLPSRDSSLTDFMNNVLGTAAGGLLAVVGPLAGVLVQSSPDQD